MDGPHTDSTSDSNSGRGASEKLNDFEYIIPGRPIMGRYLVRYPPTSSSMQEAAENVCKGLDQGRASIYIRKVGDRRFDWFKFEFETKIETISATREETEYSL